jgi:hypothetical protein
MWRNVCYSNRVMVGALAVALALTGAGMTEAQEVPEPKLRRIKMATVNVPDVNQWSALYREWLDYQVVEEGNLPVALAESWGAPGSAGKRYVLMAPASGSDVYIRAVEGDPVPGYKAMTTFGWNSIEIIVDDVDALYERLEASPFQIIGLPHSLGGGFASIHAMQVVGPGQEVLYLTCETGDREKSTLPIPKSFVDRTFIMILAGPDLDAMADFYVENFAMSRIPNFNGPLTLAARAMGIPEDRIFPLGLLRGRERGNNIELDGYPEEATPRPRVNEQLPPGVAMTSFSVDSLDGLGVKFITAPAALYDGRRAATFIGPAGELTELIEDPR